MARRPDAHSTLIHSPIATAARSSLTPPAGSTTVQVDSRGRGRGIASGAEGATAPETLRQKDRAGYETLESSPL